MTTESGDSQRPELDPTIFDAALDAIANDPEVMGDLPTEMLLPALVEALRTDDVPGFLLKFELLDGRRIQLVVPRTAAPWSLDLATDENGMIISIGMVLPEHLGDYLASALERSDPAKPLEQHVLAEAHPVLGDLRRMAGLEG